MISGIPFYFCIFPILSVQPRCFRTVRQFACNPTSYVKCSWEKQKFYFSSKWIVCFRFLIYSNQDWDLGQHWVPEVRKGREGKETHQWTGFGFAELRQYGVGKGQCVSKQFSDCRSVWCTIWFWKLVERILNIFTKEMMNIWIAIFNKIMKCVYALRHHMILD